MVFNKTFPRTIKGKNFPVWEEIELTEKEEKQEEVKCRFENIFLMKECIDDAKSIIRSKDLRRYQTNLVNIAISLFRKRASYSVHYKESKAKEKFDKKFK